MLRSTFLDGKIIVIGYAGLNQLDVPATTGLAEQQNQDRVGITLLPWRERCLRNSMTTFRLLYNADGVVLQDLTRPDDENCEVGTTKVALAVMEGFE